MKKYLALVMVVFGSLFSCAQKGIGFSLGVASSKAGMVNVEYFINKNGFSAGFSYQSNHALGKKVNDITAGSYAIGNGVYFLSADLGYTRFLSEKFSVGGEISLANKIFYQNLSDNSFSSGAYHRNYKTEFELAIGGMIAYDINDIIGVFAGYNTIREAALGLRIKFVHGNPE